MVLKYWVVRKVLWELLDSKSRLNAALYSQQLDRVAEAVGVKRPEDQDHLPTRLCQTSYRKINLEQTLEAGLGSAPHPAYSPTLLLSATICSGI